MSRTKRVQDKDGMIEKVLSKERAMLEGKPHGVGDVRVQGEDAESFIRKTLYEALEYYNRPCVQNTQEAMERTAEYFVRCGEKGIKPTFEEYALALGTTRAMIKRWENGTAKNVDYRVIERAKEVMAAFDAKALIENKMNPVAYIFRAKNFYGLKDQTDVVVTPNQLETKSKEDLIYAAEALPEE